MFYLIFREILAQPPETERTKRTQILVEIIFMVFIFIFVGGLGMHYVANELHVYTSLFSLVLPYTPFTIDPLTFTNNLNYLVYFFDEVLGHKLIFLGIFGFIVMGTILQTKHKYQRIFTRRDYFIYGFLGLLFGLGMGVSTVEGQAAFETIIFSASIIIIMLILLATKKVRLAETNGKTVKSTPFYPFSLLFFVGIVIAIIGCALYFGTMPAYPFFIQPSQKALINTEILQYILSTL